MHDVPPNASPDTGDGCVVADPFESQAHAVLRLRADAGVLLLHFSVMATAGAGVVPRADRAVRDVSRLRFERRSAFVFRVGDRSYPQKNGPGCLPLPGMYTPFHQPMLGRCSRQAVLGCGGGRLFLSFQESGFSGQPLAVAYSRLRALPNADC